MKCQDIMRRDVKCCRPQDIIAVVAATMRDENIGFMPVCDESGRAVGSITDRDLAIRAIASSLPPDTTRIEDVMTRDIVACRPDDDLRIAEEKMSQRKISRMLCSDEGLHPVGVISLSDIAAYESKGRAAAVMRSVSQRESHL